MGFIKSQTAGIVVKYVPLTRTKPARLKARKAAEKSGRWVFSNWDSELTDFQNYTEAAKKFMAEMGWTERDYAGAWTVDGMFFTALER